MVGPAGAFEQDVAFSSTVFRRSQHSARKRLLKCPRWSNYTVIRGPNLSASTFNRLRPFALGNCWDYLAKR